MSDQSNEVTPTERKASTPRKGRPTPRQKAPDAAPAPKRLRLAGGTFEPHVVIDDGELEPVQIAPMSISARDFDDFPALFREVLAQKEAELNNPAPKE